MTAGRGQNVMMNMWIHVLQPTITSWCPVPWRCAHGNNVTSLYYITEHQSFQCTMPLEHLSRTKNVLPAFTVPLALPHCPILVMRVSMTTSSRRTRVVHCMVLTWETKTTPLPRSGGPWRTFCTQPTCEGGGRVERRVTPFSSLFKLVYLHCRLTRSVRVVEVEELVHKVKDVQPYIALGSFVAVTERGGAGEAPVCV